MTSPSPISENTITPLLVTQADRDAAAELLDTLLVATEPTMLSPEDAEREITQAFARHRTRATPTDSESVERLEVVRRENAGNFERTGAAWEAYDRAVLDCIAALSQRTHQP